MRAETKVHENGCGRRGSDDAGIRSFHIEEKGAVQDNVRR